MNKAMTTRRDSPSAALQLHRRPLRRHRTHLREPQPGQRRVGQSRARGRCRRRRRCGQGGAPRAQGAVGPHERAGALGPAAQGGRRHQPPLRRIPRGRSLDTGKPVARSPAHRHSPRRRQFQRCSPTCSDEHLDRDVPHGDARTAGRAQLRRPRAARRDRGDLARGTCRCC